MIDRAVRGGGPGRTEKALMSILGAFNPRHAAIRAEMRELSIKARRPYPALLLGLVAMADTASVILTLSAL